MANSKITWNDKVSLVTDPTIAEKNKVTDSNMNEIKNVVNENADQVILSDTEPTSNDNELWVDTSSNATYINQEVNIGATNVSNTPVWFKESKNLLNLSNATTGTKNGITLSVDTTAGTITLSGTSTSYTAFDIPINLSGKNTISCDNWGQFTIYLQYNGSGVHTVTSNTTYNGNVDNMVIGIQENVTINKTIKLQVEKGETATDFEPYVRKTININGENEYYTNEYSTAEQVIGTFLGKPLYRKVYKRYNSSGSQQSYSISISNLDTVLKLDIIQKDTADNSIIKDYYWSSADYLRIFITSNNSIQVRTSKTSAYIHYITIEYTKTTD